MPKSQFAIVMGVIRESAKHHGLRFADIAKRLGVTERTVSRWFAGDRVDNVVLENLCAMIGLTLFEVCELATKRVDDRPSQPSAQQEYALAEDDLLSYAFNQALRGWTFEEIQQDLQLTQPDLVDVFIRLEKLGLIELLPGNEIKLRTAKEVRWAPNGAFSRKANQWLTRILEKVNIDEPNGVWAHDTLKLSPASRVQLERKFEALLHEAQALSDADRRANDPTRDWHGLVLVARQLDIRRPVANIMRDERAIRF